MTFLSSLDFPGAISTFFLLIVGSALSGLILQVLSDLLQKKSIELSWFIYSLLVFILLLGSLNQRYLAGEVRRELRQLQEQAVEAGIGCWEEKAIQTEKVFRICKPHAEKQP